MTDQQFCLKWNNYQNNMSEMMQTMLMDDSLVDVTLACEGASLKAHKLVLAACSPYFQSLFTSNPCSHPIVILKDVRFIDLKAVIDFMYRGEVNVTQEQVVPLLKTAETLRIKGLAEVAGKQAKGHHELQAALAGARPRAKRRRGKKKGTGSDTDSEDEFGVKKASRSPPRRRIIDGKDLVEEAIGVQVGEPSRILEQSMALAEVGDGGNDHDTPTGEVRDYVEDDVEGIGPDDENRPVREITDVDTKEVIGDGIAVAEPVVTPRRRDTTHGFHIERKTSFVWEYFEQIGDDKVQCRECQQSLSYSKGSQKGSTTSLRRHLTKHQIFDEKAPTATRQFIILR